MKRGLTLVELVITISLAAIISIPTGILISEYLNSALRARDYAVATSLARAEMERLDGLNNFFAAPDLNILCPSGGEVVTGPTNITGYPYAYTRRVRCVQGDCCTSGTSTQGVKRIQVTMTRIGVSTPLISLITYRAKNVAFGG